MYSSPVKDGYDVLASKLSAMMSAVVLVPDYQLVPVGDYSNIIQSSTEALMWLAEHGPRGESCDEHRPPLFIGGDSSGGGSALSLVLHLLHHERWLQAAVAGVFVFSAWTNLLCDTPSYYLNAFARITANVSIGGSLYVGDIMYRDPPASLMSSYRDVATTYVANNTKMLTDPIASPYHASSAIWSGAPPLYLAVSETETLSGDSVVVAHRAAAAGVRVFLDIFPGMWHDFPMYSEGCGRGQPLWQGKLVLNRTAQFVHLLAATFESHDSDLGAYTGIPFTAIHYNDPDRHQPLMPEMPFLQSNIAPLDAQLDYSSANDRTAWLRASLWLFTLLIGIVGGYAVSRLCRTTGNFQPLPTQAQQGASTPKSPRSDVEVVQRAT